jgi:hypothetical protein
VEAGAPNSEIGREVTKAVFIDVEHSMAAVKRWRRVWAHSETVKCDLAGVYSGRAV